MLTISSLAMCSCQEQRRHRNVTRLRHDIRKPHLRLIVLNCLVQEHAVRLCVLCDLRRHHENESDRLLERGGAIL